MAGKNLVCVLTGVYAFARHLSRKKQLIPYLSILHKKMSAEGALPSIRRGSPFPKRK
jgi:hypothetical protein